MHVQTLRSNDATRCYILNFIAIGPLALEKKIFKGFTIYGRGGHLGHVTQIGQNIYMADRNLLKEHFYKTFVQISAVAWK